VCHESRVGDGSALGTLDGMDAEQIVQDVAEKVRELLAQAEERAAKIVREAEEEAARIRADAEADARKRLDEVRSAVEELQGRLGGGAVSGTSTGASAEVDPGPATVPEPEPEPVPEPTPDPVPNPVPTPEPVPEPSPEPVPEPAPPPDEATPPTAKESGGKSTDAAGARLVAMNMALDGASRDEIAARLAADYELDDAEAIVDDVLALAGK